jgi:hypothetical protein
VPKPQLPPAPSGNPPSAPKPPNTGGLLPSH